MMSRYIIAPADVTSDDPTKDVTKLIPTEGIEEKPKQIEISKGIFPSVNSRCFKLLNKLNRADVRRSKDGKAILVNRVLRCKFDDFIRDCMAGVFMESYEDIYSHLRRHGITF